MGECDADGKESKGLLSQLYACGPSRLNGIGTFMQVMDERIAKGIKDDQGVEPGPVPVDWNRHEYGVRLRVALAGRKIIPGPTGYQFFVPIIDTFLQERIFTGIFSSNKFGHHSPKLATITPRAPMNAGISKAELKNFTRQLEKSAGPAQAEDTEKALEKVLENKKAA